MSAVIWIVISAVAGASAVSIIVGAILCGLVVFVIGYGFRLLVLDRRGP